MPKSAVSDYEKISGEAPPKPIKWHRHKMRGCPGGVEEAGMGRVKLELLSHSRELVGQNST